jgi:hypothetical protein
MKNSYFTRHFGVIIAIVVPILIYILSYTAWNGLSYNGRSIGFNVSVFVTLIVFMIVLIKKFYAAHPVLILVLFVVSVFLALNFALSALAYWVNNSPAFDEDGRGMSWVILLPLTYLIIII